MIDIICQDIDTTSEVYYYILIPFFGLSFGY